jgi:hypothetical protein
MIEDFDGNNQKHTGESQKQDICQFGKATLIFEIVWLKISLSKLHTDDATLLSHEGCSESKEANGESNLVIVLLLWNCGIKTVLIDNPENKDICIKIK